MPYTVLIVDDDPRARKALARLLAGTEFHALTAAEGREAMDVLAAHPVDLIVTDYSMPHLNGRALLERVRRLNPHLRGIIMSGHHHLRDHLYEGTDVVYPFVGKPIDMDKLLRWIGHLAPKSRAASAAPETGVTRH